MRDTPLWSGRKWHHQRRSDLLSLDRKQWRESRWVRRVLSRVDMKIRAGRTQAVTKDITPSSDCKSWREIEERERAEEQQWRSS